MKLVFAIVQKEDTKPLIRALIEHEISVCLLYTSPSPRD